MRAGGRQAASCAAASTDAYARRALPNAPPNAPPAGPATPRRAAARRGARAGCGATGRAAGAPPGARPPWPRPRAGCRPRCAAGMRTATRPGAPTARPPASPPAPCGRIRVKVSGRLGARPGGRRTACMRRLARVPPPAPGPATMAGFVCTDGNTQSSASASRRRSIGSAFKAVRQAHALSGLSAKLAGTSGRTGGAWRGHSPPTGTFGASFSLCIHGGRGAHRAVVRQVQATTRVSVTLDGASRQCLALKRPCGLSGRPVHPLRRGRAPCGGAPGASSSSACTPRRSARAAVASRGR